MKTIDKSNNMKKVIFFWMLLCVAGTIAAQSNESNIISVSAYKVLYFSDYAKPIVEKKINEWQVKDEFEKTADWQKRVNETTRNAKIKELTAQCEKDYLAKYTAMLKPNVFVSRV